MRPQDREIHANGAELPICSAVRLNSPLECRRDYQALHWGRYRVVGRSRDARFCVAKCAGPGEGGVLVASAKSIGSAGP